MVVAWTQRCSSHRSLPVLGRLRHTPYPRGFHGGLSLSLAGWHRPAAPLDSLRREPLSDDRPPPHPRDTPLGRCHLAPPRMRPLPLLLTVAVAALSLRPHTTLTEAHVERPPEPETDSGTQGSRTGPPPRDDCFFFGCRLTPLDVHYSPEHIKTALHQLRQSKPHTQGGSLWNAATSLLATAGHGDAVTLTLIGYKGGPLHEQLNQDRAIVLRPFRYDGPHRNQHAVLLGVFDGHAPRGELVSEFVAQELPPRVSRRLAAAAHPLARPTVQRILHDTFVELDRDAPAHTSGGCTASVILALDAHIYIANAGDSRSFVVTYRPSTQTTRVVYISREDKPDLPEERARVEAMGGQVYIPARGTSRVVYHDPRTGAPSGLAMSRSIGDWAAGKLGVVPDPVVDVIDVEALVREERRGLAKDSVQDRKDAMTSSFLVLDEQGGVEAGEPPSTSSSLYNDTAAKEEEEQQQQQQLGPDDVYVFGVSATDGMLDYLDHNDIARVLAKALFDPDGAHPLTAAEHLVFAAANGWQQDKQGRYRDDIAIAVATLRRPPQPQPEKYHDPSEL